MPLLGLYEKYLFRKAALFKETGYNFRKMFIVRAWISDVGENLRQGLLPVFRYKAL